MMSPEEKGAEAERRFFEALALRTESTPTWFKRVKISRTAEDIRGVDGKAFIYPKNDFKVTKVPIQIKSSDVGERMYQLQRPLIYRRVVVVVVNTSMSDEDIRAQTYSRLTPVHETGVRFGSFWGALMQQHIPTYKRDELIARSVTQRALAETK